MFVGIGQRGMRRGGNAEMAERALGTTQIPADLAQRGRPSELAEQHRHELAPAREAAHGAPCGCAWPGLETPCAETACVADETCRKIAQWVSLLSHVGAVESWSASTIAWRAYPLYHFILDRGHHRYGHAEPS